MLNRPKAILSALISLIPATAVAAPFSWDDDVAGWNVGYDEERKGCFIQKVFAEETRLRLGFSRAPKGGYLFVHRASWMSVVDDAKYKLTVRFPDNLAVEAIATGVRNATGGGFSIGSEGPEMHITLMKQPSVAFEKDGKTLLNISLSGTYDASIAMAACQREADATNYDSFEGVAPDR